MKSNILKILFVAVLTCVILLFDNTKDLSRFYFYFLSSFLIIEIIKRRTISLLNVWNGAFLFIILSEALLPEFQLSNSKLTALKFLISSNNILNIGYLSRVKKSEFALKQKESKKLNKSASFVLISLILFYFLFSIQSALTQFTIGRVGINSNANESFILSSIIGSLGFILPALVAYYYLFVKNTKIIIPFLVSLPVFFILFIGGTRFPLLFSFIGFVLVANVKTMLKMNFKKYLILGSSLLILLVASAKMKQTRATGKIDNEIALFKSSAVFDLPVFFAENASPEGIIDMTDLMFQYFETNDYKYGTSSSFILYFWIPREIWPSKPTMLGHWLIRDFRSGFSSGHSASFGFTGDLYADFGLFSLIFIFLLGRFLKIGEDFKNWALTSKDYVTVLGAMMFPYVFFFVRSPITATMNFLGILFFYFLIKKIIFSR